MLARFNPLPSAPVPISPPLSPATKKVKWCRTVDAQVVCNKATPSSSHRTKQYKELFLTPDPHALTPEQQAATIQAAFHNDDTLPKEEVLASAIGKVTPSRAKVMDPQKLALSHPAGPLLKYYADQGCPVDCGKDWSREHIEALLRRGPHISAKNPDAIRALNEETKGKVANGYSKIERYGDIKHNLPKKLKISPVAMVPHKSRQFRTILDLSFGLRYKGKLLESVNSSTVKQAPAEAMVQLGQCIQRLIATIADNYDPSRPFYFAKLDIKDGFWRMGVSATDAWNFCYVLPQLEEPENLDDVLIVVPNCLQMGWCESPPFFCAASETARDVITSLLTQPCLPFHEFEPKMLGTPTNTQCPEISADSRLSAAAAFTNLTEVFVDDFIGATNNADPSHLQHFSRAMLLGIHSVFPPPHITGHQGEDPISQKKLNQGEGLWETTKEILGWIVDGARYTIKLDDAKCTRMVKQIKSITRRKRSVSLLEFQQLAGRLQHASFGIPGGKGLFSPIYSAMKTSKDCVTVDSDLKQTLFDWRALVQNLAAAPTPVQLLVSDYPHYLITTDACGLGAGGVITPGLAPIDHWVWKLEWPSEIKAQLITESNPSGSLTINDLELAGMVLGWLTLEMLPIDLSFKHIGLFCDNTSAVSWALKGSTSTSLPASRLLRFLALRQRERQTSSLLPLHIAGTDNKMADAASRAFKHGEYFHIADNLLSYFNSTFPLQTGSWRKLTVHPSLVSRVMSCLRGALSQMESLLRLPKRALSIGTLGAVTANNSRALIPTSSQSTKRTKLSSSPASLHAHGPGPSASEIKSKFLPSRTRSRPSPRPLNWLENKVPSTKRRENTFFPSNVASKASDAMTLLPSLNLPSQSLSPKQWQK